MRMYLYSTLIVSLQEPFFFISADDGKEIDPAVLSTLKKLQDGYYGGAR